MKLYRVYVHWGQRDYYECLVVANDQASVRRHYVEQHGFALDHCEELYLLWGVDILQALSESIRNRLASSVWNISEIYCNPLPLSRYRLALAVHGKEPEPVETPPSPRRLELSHESV